MFNNFNINLPPHLNTTVLKSKDNYILYLYNSNFNLIFLFILKTNLKLNIETNCITIEKIKTNKNNIKNINYINNLLKSWDIYFFFKIKFKGKGYRIRFYKKNKIVKFFFGKSHITYYSLKNLILKKINKYKFILKSSNKFYLKNLSKEITKIKPLNVYTLRGLRVSREKIFKRKGKKGSYI